MGRNFSVRTLLTVVVLAALFFLLIRRPIETSSKLLAPGEMMPEIVTDGWLNEPAPTAEELRDHIVVVDVWAYWCGPCREALPAMVAAFEKYKDRDVRFIGLTMEGGDKIEDTRAVIDSAHVPYPNGYGAVATIGKLGVTYIPAVFVVGRNGRIVWNNDRPGTVEEAIESALAKN
ncbi:MAG TPA: TlpA disulfide reductase family protein [Pirellulales bacterium]|nr:TlpA disulfide reductase family protein [Pirellulales bacterium]